MKIIFAENGNEQYCHMHDMEWSTCTSFKKRFKEKLKEYEECTGSDYFAKKRKRELEKEICSLTKYIHRHFVIEPKKFSKEYVKEFLKTLDKEELGL